MIKNGLISKCLLICLLSINFGVSGAYACSCSSGGSECTDTLGMAGCCYSGVWSPCGDVSTDTNKKHN